MVDAINNSDDKYKITFSGIPLSGISKDVLSHRFAQAFHISDPSKLKKLFSGSVVTLKRGLAYEKAVEYRDKLEHLGADCLIEPDIAVFSDNEEVDREYARKKRRKLAEFNKTDFSLQSLGE